MQFGQHLTSGKEIHHLASNKLDNTRYSITKKYKIRDALLGKYGNSKTDNQLIKRLTADKLDNS